MNKFIPLLVFLFFSTVQLYSQSIELDKKIGKENATKIAEEMNLSLDSIQQNYISEVGEKLTTQLEKQLFDYSFHIVHQEEPNAFALPGGHIYITTGLLYLIEREDELACILGHEIIHSQNRHSVKQIKKSILPKLAEVPGQIVGVFAHNVGTLINAPLQTSNALLFASYGRKFENEADEQGITLAAKAGYDPEAMINILDRMTTTMETVGNFKEQKSYFSHHPYTPNRIKTIQKVVRKMDIETIEVPTDNYLASIDSLSYGLPSEMGSISENRFSHRDLNFSFEFPYEWSLVNNPSAIKAINPKRNATMMLTLKGDSITAKKAAVECMEQMPTQYKQLISKAEPIVIMDKDCFVIESQQVSQHGKTVASIYFIPLNNKLFQITCYSPIEYQFQIKESLHTLRALSDQEKSEITNKRLRIVKANKGESIFNISERVANVLDLELLSILNSTTEEIIYEGGEKVKVVIEY